MPLASKRVITTSIMFILPIVARSAAMVSRKPATPAFMHTSGALALRASSNGIARRGTISPALRGGNSGGTTNGGMLSASRQLRTQRMMQGIQMSSSTSNVLKREKSPKELQWPADRVRSKFIEFFEKNKAHVFVRSSPVVPLEDPTLLFTNAGMNQFKPIFLGQVDPKSPMAAYEKAGRAVNSQKCIRAGGKHNDLDDVGKDTYHHTFFEMLGTWSFGNYFKQEAVEWAWEILTDPVSGFGLPKDRLYATYCEGNVDKGGTVPMDTETRDMWLKYLPPNRVLKGSMKDNFWEMGDTGPCGPCTELHFDRIGGRDAAHLVNNDDPDVLEVWNLVFIQFNREASGSLATLPAQHVDTGMGFERLVSVLQDKRSNYDTDVFTPLFDTIQNMLNIAPYTGKVGKDDTDLKDTAYRVLADHARTLSYAIADGAMPSNEGRGYVLRRVLRRAVRYGQQILNAPPGFFSKLIPTVVETYKDTFPELEAKQQLIIEVVREEEESFEKMLVGGIKYFKDVSASMAAAKQTVVSGKDAFFLYDTMGFPIDLTQIMAAEKSFSVDVSGFEKEMAAQKARSREAAKSKKAGDGVDLALGVQETAWLQNNKIAPTDDSNKFIWHQALPATVQAVYTEKGFLSNGDKSGQDEPVGIIVDKTSYYAESGGQVGDSGEVSVLDADGKEVASVTVYDTQIFAGFVLHKGRVTKGSVAVGSQVKMAVDYARRGRIAPNHSMTHVMNFALRKVLGGEVDQKGSLCDEDKLRFDFTAKGALTVAQLSEVEAICREQIAAALPVDAEVVPLKKAMAVQALRAVFGEQYPDPVRVLSVGAKVCEMIASPSDGRWMGASVELCGGTHIANTKEAQAFALVQEEAVAKGIRRITAVTRDAAAAAIASGAALEQRLKEADVLPKAHLGPLLTALKQELDAATMSTALKSELRARHDALSKEYMAEKKKAAAELANVAIAEVLKQIEALGSAKAAVLQVNIDDSSMLKSVMSAAAKAAPAMGICLAATGEDGKASFICNAPNAGKGPLKANDWLTEILKVGGGKGGGKPDSAQGQLPDASKIKEAIAAAKAFADAKL